MSFLTVVICDNTGCTSWAWTSSSPVYDKIKNWIEVQNTQTQEIYYFCPTHAPKK